MQRLRLKESANRPQDLPSSMMETLWNGEFIGIMLVLKDLGIVTKNIVVIGG
ncbi:hypothetical protein PsorP6_004142 [Peronosclerospora sorghi]|uniref:Uncharacterized protein n=1 Tax=Peronosclerospora sorghi TaxID=230839 RepID=A0ACC0VPZ2_9STRA|nr:hypothetical protein PsorP6_004142 [Peronosclerospora sorghi]